MTQLIVNNASHRSQIISVIIMNRTNNMKAGPSNCLFNIGEIISESKRQIRTILIRHKAFYEPCTMDDIRKFTDHLKEGYDKVFDEFIAETLSEKSNQNAMKDKTDSNENYIIVSDEESQSSEQIILFDELPEDTILRDESPGSSGTHMKRSELCTETKSDEENVNIDRLFTGKSNRIGLDKIVEPSQMSSPMVPRKEDSVDEGEYQEKRPRTPGRESSPIEPKKKKSYDYDRLHSDSEQEREYQEKRRQNTECIGEIEREFIEEQLKKQQHTGETTEDEDETLPEKAPSPGSKLLSLPDKRSRTAAKQSNELIEVSDHWTVCISGPVTNDDDTRRKLSSAKCSSTDSQISQMSQVQLEHCYFLQPTNPPQSSSITSYASVPNCEADNTKPSISNVYPATRVHGISRNQPKRSPQFKGAAKTNNDNDELSMVSSQKRNKAMAEFVPRERYQKRNPREQAMLLYEFLNNGIDAEDIAYIKRRYEFLLHDHQNHSWLNATHFMDHCVTGSLDSPENERQHHVTGSARTEGYYKVDFRDKMRFKYHHNKSLNDKIKNEIISKTKGSRAARLNRRRIASTEGKLLEFKQLKLKERRLKLAKSSNDDWGLYAMEPIAANEMVIEYVGETIRPVVADLREMKYKAFGIEGTYMFGLDSDTIIDSTNRGNIARVIKHSCNPNCYSEIISIESEHSPALFNSLNDIQWNIIQF